MARRPFKPAPAKGPRKQTPRERTLAQWRRVDTTPLEVARTLRAKKAGDLLPKVLTDLRMDSRQAEAEILKVWNAALPPEITQHAQPTGIKHGTLFISVDSSVWLAELVRFHQKEILAQLRTSFSEETIKKLSFRLT